MSNEVLVKQGNKAEWARDNVPIDPSRLPEGYPWNDKSETVIEWDGNTEGRAVVGTEFFKVSNAMSFNLVGCKVAYYIQTGPDAPHELRETVVTHYGMDDGVHFNEINVPELGSFACIAVVPEDNGTYEAGTYFANAIGGIIYVSALIIITETIHPISSDFLPLATPTAAGAMKQAAAVANVTAAPTAEEFNALLKSLRDAGILATS